MNKQETEKYIFDKYKISSQESPIIIDIKRSQLAKLFAELGLNTGAEIGVEKGINAKMLFEANPNLKLFGIDVWTTYKGYRDDQSKDKMEGFYNITKELLSGYNCVLINDWSMEAVKQFKDGSLDFVFIDGNHEFKYIAEDIVEWSKKVRPGGIVSGHDYVTDVGNCQVRSIVDAWVKVFGIKPLFSTVHGSPSWFYVK